MFRLLNVKKSILRNLRGRQESNPTQLVFKDFTDKFSRTVFTIRLFYCYSAFFCLSTMNWAWPRLNNNTFYRVLWPLGAIDQTQIPKIIPLVFISWLMGSIISILNPGLLYGRALQFTGVFFFVALMNSDGHFGHDNHALVWVSMTFLLVPNLNQKLNRKNKAEIMNVFWLAQLVICTFYFMTGVWKVLGILKCFFTQGLVCELTTSILTNISANEYISYQSFAPLRFIIFDYPILGFLSYIVTIWIHLASLHFLFRPDINDLFGAFRVIFHLGTFLLFGVNFSSMTGVIIILFLTSPFSEKDQSLMNKIYRLPLVGYIINLMAQQRKKYAAK